MFYFSFKDISSVARVDDANIIRNHRGTTIRFTRESIVRNLKRIHCGENHEIFCTSMLPSWTENSVMKRTIKAPLIGPSSYKEHGFRMLMIWASGLNPEISVGRELCDALSAVDKKSVAGEKSLEKFLLTFNYSNAR